MTASGPFALGPGEGSGRRAAPSMRIVYGASGPAAIGPAGSGSHTGLHARSLLSRANRLKAEEEDPEQYSDPDEPNMEIVDLNDVKALDWMAPDTLRRIKAADRNAKGGKMKMNKIEEPIVKAEKDYMDTGLLDSADVGTKAEKDLANALDLSESEEEEVLEDVVEDFIRRSQPPSQTDNFEANQELSQDNRLYFFQFPSPFPTFGFPPNSAPSERQGGSLAVPIDLENSSSPSPATTEREHPRKSVSFAPETKPPAPVSETLPKVEEPLDGVIGRLEIYKSGAVKMRLGEGIVLDVTAATQPSFLQHIVCLDTQAGEEGKTKKTMTVLGEVNRRFIVSPDVDVLLEQVEGVETVVTKSDLDTHELLPMDVDD
ncbi:hypothetical protein BS47DRAFT_1325929 [Hydnum rufescens UP504]|uniref:Uncharacterized protein n=1 Tax=Hydnum rufescens UP504 TaxID=1448309 RepID=A0A9P6B4Y1_9AGAM|nr:hypothetical protein BS47DRAFT_1325929 [Hydnum rufescens UP504]